MNPTEVWLSRHFLLSDFIGCHSVYSRGLRNDVDPTDPELPLKLRNGRSLCEHLLEPILDAHGPVSVSYGIIRPSLSREIVKYQDPGQPSHHLWNLGAAADICVHRWTNDDPDRDDQQNSPANLALFGIHERLGLPYSRLISYSESPYLCIAASALEIQEGAPRRAFYENRYCGRPRIKPTFIKLASPGSKKNAVLDRLFADPLEHGWRGAGYPTYHGGGRRQFQHVRVSKYTMLSDWLMDWKLIAKGISNIPNWDDAWSSLFFACGDVYDAMIDALNVPRLPIVQAFVSPSNRGQAAGPAWSKKLAYFSLAVPEYVGWLLATEAMHDVARALRLPPPNLEGRIITFSVYR